MPNGSILRVRQLSDFTAYGALASSTYQILYKTSDPVSTPKKDIATPMTVIVPRNAANNTAQTNVLMYQVPYDAASVDCGPSYLSASNSSADPTGGEGPFIQLALQQGLVVVLSDYEGPDAAFTVGELSGQGVNDAIRAVLDFKPAVPDKKKAQVVLQGYSGGALATGWAVQVQPTYAPE